MRSLNHDFLNKINPVVRNISAYDLKQLPYRIKLNQNENPYEIPASVKKQILDDIQNQPWRIYPEFKPTRLIQALSKFYHWPSTGVLVGNGSNEMIIATLMAALAPGKCVAIPIPTFSLYKHFSQILGAKVLEIPLTADLQFDKNALIRTSRRQDVDVLIINTPNNPTGCYLSPAEIHKIVKGTRSLVILDQAYQDFASSPGNTLLAKEKNVIVLRTFSKALGLAGVRIGCLMTSPKLCQEINKCRLPYNIGIFPQRVTEYLLKNPLEREKKIDRIIKERARVFKALKKIRNLEVFPSQANFILIRVFDSQKIFNELLRCGILIRDVSHYPMLKKCLRFSIGLPRENDQLIRILQRSCMKSP